MLLRDTHHTRQGIWLPISRELPLLSSAEIDYFEDLSKLFLLRTLGLSLDSLYASFTSSLLTCWQLNNKCEFRAASRRETPVKRVRVTPGLQRRFAGLNPGFTDRQWPGFSPRTHPLPGLGSWVSVISEV